MEKRQAKTDALRESSRRAFAERRWFAGAFGLLSRLGHALTSKPPTPTLERPDRDETVWNAGSEGERRVAETFGATLSDEWVLVSGYRNSGGEIDQLLVGPPGVLAVEIKFINGRVFCDGDDWWRDKYDRYGNLVERSVPIGDRGGRSPSAQVNAAAGRLQSFLNKRASLQRVHRAVILSHDASELGEVPRSHRRLGGDGGSAVENDDELGTRLGLPRPRRAARRGPDRTGPRLSRATSWQREENGQGACANCGGFRWRCVAESASYAAPIWAFAPRL